MNKRNWIDLGRKTVDKFDMNLTTGWLQEALGLYAAAYWGKGVLKTSRYLNPFVVSLSGITMSGSVTDGLGFDDNGILIEIKPTSLTPKTFNIPLGDAIHPRKDLLVVRYVGKGDTVIPRPSNAIQSTFLNIFDDFELIVRAGVPAPVPSYPTKQQGDLVLGGIQVPIGASVGSGCVFDLAQREYARTNFSTHPEYVQEVPVGTVDGSNLVFTLSKTPIDAPSLFLFLDGLAVSTADYTIYLNQITFNVAPAFGQEITALYFPETTNSDFPLSGYQEIPLGTVDGVNSLFTLTGQPADQRSTMVFKNGLLVPMSDWSLVQGTTCKIQFQPSAIPAIASDLYVFYFINPNTIGQGPGGGGGGGGGDGALIAQGSVSFPIAINGAVGIPILDEQRQIAYLRSSGGAVTITANPQIQSSLKANAEMILIGQSDINYPIINQGNGVNVNGPLQLKNKVTAHFVWDGAEWNEISRR